MDVAGTVLTATIWAYWLGVGAMIVRVRRHARKAAGVVPEQSLERFMWMVWVPLVAGWILLPWQALERVDAPWALPAFARGTGWYAALRLGAALVAVACLAGTIKCWSRMGKDWRMAVTPGEDQSLITDGMFSRVRHPIYALSILLMLCTMVVVPTAPMLALGVVHIVLMVVKAANEERHLLARHGATYARYLAATGRFVPRMRNGGPG
jgi:protein-S-isoprenylcysteine O-methyltransferase Ste14